VYSHNNKQYPVQAMYLVERQDTDLVYEKILTYKNDWKIKVGHAQIVHTTIPE